MWCESRQDPPPPSPCLEAFQGILPSEVREVIKISEGDYLALREDNAPRI